MFFRCRNSHFQSTGIGNNPKGPRRGWDWRNWKLKLNYPENTISWMVPTLSPISTSFCFSHMLFRAVSSALIKTGMTVTFMCHDFLSFLAKSRYSSVFLLFFRLPLQSAGSIIWDIVFFLLNSNKFNLITVWISKTQRILCI